MRFTFKDKRQKSKRSEDPERSVGLKNKSRVKDKRHASASSAKSHKIKVKEIDYLVFGITANRITQTL